MRTTRRYVPGKGVVETRTMHDETVPRKGRLGRSGRKGDIWFDHTTRRLNARGKDGKVVGLELPRGT